MKRILIVDDDVELAGGLADVLKKEGYEVETLETLDDGRRRLFRNHDVPDLLILDIMFPENPAGGFDLAREIRKDEQTSGLPVVMLTAINQEFPMDFSAADLDDDWMPSQEFIEKPPRIPELLDSVRKLVG